MSERRAPVVLRPHEIPASDRGGGVRTVPLITRRTGARDFINGYTFFPPLAAVPLHIHNCDESVVLLEGRGVAHIDGVEHEVGPDDATLIPEGTPHFFRNASNTDEMKILWTYASVEANRTIIATGETRLIDDEHTQPAGPDPIG